MAIALSAALVANPNYREYNVTAQDADVGPTAFNHGLNAVSANDVICWVVPQVSLANNVFGYWGTTWTATQVSLSKQNSAGSGGAVPGTTVIGILCCWNTHTMVR